MAKGTVSRGVVRDDDLNPDGVRVVIDWGSMVVGSSIFIPCINTHGATEELRRICVVKGWEHSTVVRVEDGKLGVRMWRTL